MPRKSWLKNLATGHVEDLYEGSFRTKAARWQVIELRRKVLPDIVEMIEYVGKIIKFDATIEDGDFVIGGGNKVLDEVDVEIFYSRLNEISYAAQQVMRHIDTTMPLQRRIELVQQTIDHPRTEPEVRETAENRLEVLKKRLEEGER